MAFAVVAGAGYLPQAAALPLPDAKSSQSTSAKRQLLARLDALEARQAVAAKSASELEALSKETMPAGLSGAERRLWPLYVKHLAGCSVLIARLHGAWKPELEAMRVKLQALEDDEPAARRRSDASSQPIDSSARLAEMNQAFNMQYLALQALLHFEHGKFTGDSRGMKAALEAAQVAMASIQ